MLIEFGTLFYVSMVVSIIAAFWLTAWYPLSGAPLNYGHMLRNIMVWLAAFALADYVVADYWLGLPELLLAQPPGLMEWLSVTDPWVLGVVGVVALDLADYGFHRLSHRYHWLWRLHALHHTDTMLDISTTLRGHPLELVLSNFWKLGAAFALGIPIWVLALREVFVFPLIFLQHADIRLPRRLEEALARVVVTPRVHRVHHAVERATHDSNYGEGLILWDKLFGSYRHPQSDRPPAYGLRDCDGPEYQSLDGMLLTPLRVRRSRSRSQAS